MDSLQLGLNGSILANDLKSQNALATTRSRDKTVEHKASNLNQSTSIGGSTRMGNFGTSIEHNLGTDKSSKIHNINGSFLHFDTEKGGKILDLSKRVLKSPRNLIVGEKGPSVVGLNYRVPWNNTSVHSISSASKPNLNLVQSPSFLQRPAMSPINSSIQY